MYASRVCTHQTYTHIAPTPTTHHPYTHTTNPPTYLHPHMQCHRLYSLYHCSMRRPPGAPLLHMPPPRSRTPPTPPHPKPISMMLPQKGIHTCQSVIQQLLLGSPRSQRRDPWSVVMAGPANVPGTQLFTCFQYLWWRVCVVWCLGGDACAREM